MKIIYEYENYLSFLQERIKSLPKNGRGEPARLARLLNISSVAFSHIMHGKNLLNLDQALAIAKDYSLSKFEIQYFLKLVELERAGTQGLKDYIYKELNEIKTTVNDLSHFVLKEDQLPQEALGQFYSDWIYSGIRMFSALDNCQNIQSICDYFSLSREKAESLVEFLLDYGLIKNESGVFQVGLSSTHLSKNSPFVNNHRRNWRLKGLEKLKETKEEDIFYSSPFAMGNDDIEWFRDSMRKLIKELHEKVKDSPCESLVCFNVDFFKF